MQAQPVQPPQLQASNRILRPSQQQRQTRSGSPLTSAPPSTSTAKLAPAAPTSVLSRDHLQTNLKYYQFLTRVQHLLIDTAAVSVSTLHRASLVLRPVDLDEVVQERSNDGRCGWPACSNEPQRDSKVRKGRYRLSMREHKVWEVDASAQQARYCSEQCEEAAAEYLLLLKEDPVYMRRVGELMAEQQSGDQQQPEQQSTQKVLASLPTQASAPSSQDALRAALPPNADTSSLLIKENSDETVQAAVSGQAAVTDLSHQQLSHGQRSQPSIPPSSPPAAVIPFSSKPSYVHSTPSSSSSFKPRTTVAFDVPIEPKVLPAASDAPEVEDDDEDELLDTIARIAISEKSKLNQTTNPASDAPRHRSLSRPAANDDDEVRSAEEEKENFAALRKSNPLSPFAQLAGLLTHYVTDDTIALLRGSGSMDVTPASSELIRRRQEALLGWLHGELRVVCAAVDIRHTKDVEDAVDDVGLTFLLNEQVPALSRQLWQVVLVVMLSALHRRTGGGVRFVMDEALVSKFVGERGVTDVHLAALMDIILPPYAGSCQTTESTPSPQSSTAVRTTVVTNSSSSAPLLTPAAASTSLSSVPRYIVSSVLSFLDSSDLSAASLVCSLFRQLSHPFSEHRDERTLLAHNQSLATTRLHTVGYREGVQRGRELLMQSGFDTGAEEGWKQGRAEEWPKGVLGALTLWSEKRSAGQSVPAVPSGWSAGDVGSLWQRCERVNGAVMRRPKERGGRGAIVAADDEKATEGDLLDYCAGAMSQLAVDGKRVVDQMRADMGVGTSVDLGNDDNARAAEERVVEARIAAELGKSCNIHGEGDGKGVCVQRGVRELAGAVQQCEEDGEDFI